MNKKLYFAGIIAAMIYPVALITCSFLWSGFNQLSDPISKLVSTDSPLKDFYDWLFTIMGLSLLLFSVGMAKIWQMAGNRKLEISGIMLILYSMANLPIKYFHMDQIGYPTTLSGAVYYELIGVVTLTSILAIFFAAYGFGEARGLDLKLFSLIIGVIVILSGLISSLNLYTHYYGLIERVTTGAFMLWVFVVALDLFLLQNEVEKRPGDRIAIV